MHIITLFLEFVKRKLGFIPWWLTLIVFLFIGGTIGYLAIFEPTKTSSHEFIEAPKIETHTSRPLETQPQPEARNTQSISETRATDEDQANSADQNREVTRNYTLIHHTMLNLFKAEGYDESFVRNLSYKVRENLKDSKTSLEHLDESIREELGSNTNQEEVEKVRSLVIKSVSIVADMDLSGPKPTPEP